MTIKLSAFIAITLCSGCLSLETPCCDFVDSYPISKSLYIENYRTFCAGVFGETIDCYITDSVSFRQIIGSHDEHESFYVKQNGDKIEAYNFISQSIPDTVAKITMSKVELFTKHQTNSNCLITIPIFGKNTISCNTDYYPASSYQTEDGNYITQVQYKCGNEYLNAVYYTDSLNFSVFIGVYEPGSLSNNYSVKLNKNNYFDFYNVEYKNVLDTVKHQTYLVSELRKKGIEKVCK